MPSNIEWTDETWNPVTGCTKVSQGCKHCYAEREWARLSANPKATAYAGRAFNDVRVHPDRLALPLRWAKPRKVFVNSMSDLFHEDVPDEFIDTVFAVMALTPWHTFQVLTKRPDRMLRWFEPGYDNREHAVGQVMRDISGGRDAGLPEWPLPNVWLGVSVEDQATADERIPMLLRTPAAVRWISAEPLLGPVDLAGASSKDRWTDHDGVECCALPRHLDWVVAGGESGPKARPVHPDWARGLRDQCARAGVPFLWKQWGAWRPICQGGGDWSRALYRSNRVARPGEDQGAMDEIYGRRCLVPQLCLRVDGKHAAITAPNAFLLGTRPVQAFMVGKKAAGRLLDGVQHDAYPGTAGLLA